VLGVGIAFTSETFEQHGHKRTKAKAKAKANLDMMGPTGLVCVRERSATVPLLSWLMMHWQQFWSQPLNLPQAAAMST
jgi:hypothetical protein